MRMMDEKWSGHAMHCVPTFFQGSEDFDKRN